MAPNPNGMFGRVGTDPTSLGGFRLTRARTVMQGYVPDIDPSVRAELDDLDALLTSQRVDGQDHKVTLTSWAGKPLTPRRYQARGSQSNWAQDSLAEILYAKGVGVNNESFGQVLDSDAAVAEVRYAFDGELSARYHELDAAQRAVLDRRGLRDLIIARGALTRSLTNIQALFNFAMTSTTGVADIVNYAIVSAARKWVAVRQITIANIADDEGAPAKALREARPSITDSSFVPTIERLLEAYIANAKYEKWVDDAKVTWLSTAQRAALIAKLKASPGVTDVNAKTLVPIFAAQIMSAAPPDGAPTGPAADDPFHVDFYTGATSHRAVSAAAVRCSAQLYYVMTLGDELATFDAMRFFTHRYLLEQGFAIEDRTLRRDLEDYVFNEQFLGYDAELQEHRVMRVTHEAERRAFYKQVFDLGGSPLPDGAIANTDFGRLWRILMLESARFLERAQSSPNPDTYVSRQNVMQAVEDLQYNLSTTCVGMATVMTPLIYAEFDFLRKRVLGHEEVLKHFAPAGGSWLTVVERLGAAQGRRLRPKTLDDKASFGCSLLQEISAYSPTRFELDGEFSRFISTVDAFITTQSILQEEHGRLEDEAESEGGGHTGYGVPGMPPIPMPAGMPPIPSMPDAAGTPAAQDPWNF